MIRYLHPLVPLYSRETTPCFRCIAGFVSNSPRDGRQLRLERWQSSLNGRTRFQTAACSQNWPHVSAV